MTEPAATPALKRILDRAESIARRHRQRTVAPEHYLLALEGLGRVVLEENKVSLEELEAAFAPEEPQLPFLERLRREAWQLLSLGPHRLSPGVHAERVIQAMSPLAKELGHPWLGSIHLLLALARTERTRAHAFLKSHELDESSLRDAAIALIDRSSPYRNGTAWTRATVLTFKQAQVEAARLGHATLAPEHYLLALLRLPGTRARALLARLAPDLIDLLLDLERRVAWVEEPASVYRAPNRDAVRVLNAAKQIAEEWNNGWVGTEHLLAALSEQEAAPSGLCLQRFGIRKQAVAQALQKKDWSNAAAPDKLTDQTAPLAGAEGLESNA